MLLRKGHPALRKKWTAEVYGALEHAVISVAGRGGGSIDELLAKQGVKRRVSLKVAYPLLAPLLVEGSDLAVTTVRWLAVKLAAKHEVVVRRPPMEVPRVKVPMVWHDRAHRDPRTRWVRQLLVAVARELPAASLRW